MRTYSRTGETPFPPFQRPEPLDDEERRWHREDVIGELLYAAVDQGPARQLKIYQQGRGWTVLAVHESGGVFLAECVPYREALTVALTWLVERTAQHHWEPDIDIAIAGGQS